ncbi:MAG: tRNA preQ1(34) S-adenosylmethionine ribosyltransferase-isomerase QueA [Acidobacteriia bacterium]|nr:tRNA preQ1(34) S-adenosylmethionine ribosyltransferase-isomerase QueA [Terriglobia bacterium]
MKVSDFDFYLPDELIAQYPLPRRDLARLMVLDHASGVTDHYFYELPDLLTPGDLLVLNDTRVLRARLFGHRLGTQAAPRTKKADLKSQIEVLLLKPQEGLRWEALVKPGRKMRVGEVVVFGEGELRATVVDRGELGWRLMDFECPGDFFETLQRLGHVPLPPYIQRPDAAQDEADYQTVYARSWGAVAAPTAGLHFTEKLLKQLRERGIDHCEITLHVGLGTFQPVHVEDVEQHVLHREWFEVSEAAAERIQKTRERGGRVVAVGTTAVRTLEQVAQKYGSVRAAQGETGLFIFPGFRFRVTDALITNFHLPRSTLLMLVAALGGRERLLETYRIAIQRGYRFFSYGDAMLLLGPPSTLEN